MPIDPNLLVPIFAIGVGLIVAVTSILASTISKYKLNVEKIRADAMVRAEEVRTRNQMELEKMMRQENKESIKKNESADFDAQQNEDSTRQRSRVRE